MDWEGFGLKSGEGCKKGELFSQLTETSTYTSLDQSACDIAEEESISVRNMTDTRLAILSYCNLRIVE